MFALIFRSKVTEICPQEFPVSSELEFVDITGLDPQPKTEWEYDGVSFSEPIVESAELWSRLRTERNGLLKLTDWWALTDATAMTEAQIAYRVALRDLPANTEDPAAPIWPTKP